MNSKDKKRHPGSGKDQADGQGEGRRDPFEAASPQPQGTPSNQSVDVSKEQEKRSDLADIGAADEQEGTPSHLKPGSKHQDPPATLPHDQRRERRHNM